MQLVGFRALRAGEAFFAVHGKLLLRVESPVHTTEWIFDGPMSNVIRRVHLEKLRCDSEETEKRNTTIWRF